MSFYDFDKLIDRSHTSCVKYDARDKVFGKSDVIPLWVADMDFAVAPEIHEAIVNRASHPIFGYTLRCNEFYGASQGWLDKRFDWQIDVDQISFSPGVVSAVAMALLAFTKPGDKVVVQSPVYFPFFSTVENNGRRILNNELVLKDDQYVMDFETLENQIGHQTKMIILCNPHNPVGRAWTKPELQKLADIAEKNDLIVVSDEIHADIVFEGHKHTPFATVSKYAAQNTITCMSPSKTFNLAGLSTSIVVVENKQLMNDYNQMIESYHIGLTNPFGLEALKAAYNNGEAWLEALLQYLQRNRDYVYDFIKSEIPSIVPIMPECTFLMWLDFRSFPYKSGRELNDWLVKDVGVGLNDGVVFGDGGAGFRRLNFGCPRITLEMALQKLKKEIDILK